MKSPWKKISSKIVHKNPWWRVRRDKLIRPDGGKGVYFVVESPDSIFVVPVDSQNRIVLIKQFRYPTQMWSWEIVAGQTDGQSYPAAARRELWEETGIKAGRLTKVGSFQVWNGVAKEMGNVFIARNLSPAGKNKMGEEAIVEVKSFSPREILNMISKGNITDSQTISAITQTLIYLKAL